VYGKETSATSPKGKNAASRFAAVTMGAKPPTNTVAFQRDWSVISKKIDLCRGGLPELYKLLFLEKFASEVTCFDVGAVVGNLSTNLEHD
jgi:hypothetical protein